MSTLVLSAANQVRVISPPRRFPPLLQPSTAGARPQMPWPPRRHPASCGNGRFDASDVGTRCRKQEVDRLDLGLSCQMRREVRVVDRPTFIFTPCLASSAVSAARSVPISLSSHARNAAALRLASSSSVAGMACSSMIGVRISGNPRMESKPPPGDASSPFHLRSRDFGANLAGVARTPDPHASRVAEPGLTAPNAARRAARVVMTSGSKETTTFVSEFTAPSARERAP